ncbi:hypothetical protein J437_LFUL014658 [Ladona fulva]|uniref:Uncharacterized protein n=1 Tax=Ladona fulva TaxID=123851 RepID=A0A8K0KGC9_LADFU|nr:hypothetical protein J437_LFUL014658 [Ladona fulva]
MEMEKMNVRVLGMAEMRWPDNGDIWSGDYHVIHTGMIEKRRGQAGVRVVLSKELGRRVKGYVQCSGRVILVKIETKPTDTGKNRGTC